MLVHSWVQEFCRNRCIFFTKFFRISIFQTETQCSNSNYSFLPDSFLHIRKCKYIHGTTQKKKSKKLYISKYMFYKFVINPKKVLDKAQSIPTYSSRERECESKGENRERGLTFNSLLPCHLQFFNLVSKHVLFYSLEIYV